MKDIIRDLLGDIRWASSKGEAPRVIVGCDEPLVPISSSYITLSVDDKAESVSLNYPRSNDNIVCQIDDGSGDVEGIMAFVAQPASDKLAFFVGIRHDGFRDRLLTALIRKWKEQTADWQEHLDRAQAISFAPITHENLASLSESVNAKAKEEAKRAFQDANSAIKDYYDKINRWSEKLFVAKRILQSELGLNIAELTKQLGFIQRQSVGVTIDDKRIIVYTKPIIAECKGERFDIGQLKIMLHLTSGSAAIKPFVGNCERFPIPHVLDSGNLCQGDQEQGIRDDLMAGKVQQAYAKILSVIMYPNPDDSYGWPLVREFPRANS